MGERPRRARMKTLRENCRYSELFWSVFSRIRTKYEEIQSISPYSVQKRGNADQNNSENEHFSRRENSVEISMFQFRILLTKTKTIFRKRFIESSVRWQNEENKTAKNKTANNIPARILKKCRTLCVPSLNTVFNKTVWTRFFLRKY